MTELVRKGTPVEPHTIEGRAVLVKREDLCCPYPGPAFSKIRGVEKRIASRPESTIGVLDTFHSKAGWAVAYVCRALGKQCVDFYPQYISDGETIRRQQQEAARLGAIVSPLKAGRSAILYHDATKRARELGAYMMPNALKLEESVVETAREVAHSIAEIGSVPEHWVVSASSGTIASGVIRGIIDAEAAPVVWIHQGYSRSDAAIRKYLREKTDRAEAFDRLDLRLVDEGYEYKQAVDIRVPFPCNPYYDAKAWLWLTRSIASIEGGVLFWNIGE